MKKHHLWRSTSTLLSDLTPIRFERVKTRIQSFLFNSRAWILDSNQNINKNILNGLNLVGTIILISISDFTQAQNPACTAGVPFHNVNLTGQPSGTWISPSHSRAGSCCSGSNNCTSFDVTLDPNGVMVNLEIASGAIPTGSMYYQVDCGPQVPVGEPICISGTGPHHITFCKPGNNQNTYRITSISRPIFPDDATVRYGCTKQLVTAGLITSSITWTSIYPGTTGQYDSFLSCASGCGSPIYTPTAIAPAYIDYKICGNPIASSCGYSAACDTVRIFNVSALAATVTPTPAYFCSGGSGVLLTATATGGYGAYTYSWRDQSGTILGTATTYQATSAGIYTLEVRDALYDPATCPPVQLSIPVTVALPPVANAGSDQTICANMPIAYLLGNLQNASAAIWTGGNGNYNPSNTSLTIAYTPTAAEIASGSVTLTLASTDADGGCVNSSDLVTIFYPPVLTTSLTAKTLLCHNSITTISATITGGIGPYAFNWSTGAVTSSITGGQGNYCVSVMDMMGCHVTVCENLIAPTALALSMSSVDVTMVGGNDGSATASPSGATAPYTYQWAPGGQTTQTATGLIYGAYVVYITDANGCMINSSVVVNQPPCNNFNASVTGTNVLCHGDFSGTVLASTTGGISPFSYAWGTSGSVTTQSITGLEAGTYFVTVTDAVGCVDIASITLTEPAELINTLNHTNITAVGANNGDATANTFGGTTPYTYSWSNGQTTSSIFNLGPGSYVVTITDANGCTLQDSTTIVEPPCDKVILGVYVTNVSCKGGNNGSATAQMLFGTTPYTYEWSTGETTATITGLVAGTYSVTVRDLKNCSDFKIVTITEPSILSISLAASNVLCANSNDGTLELTVGGGTFPYSYSWSNGINVEDQYSLGNGTYSVIVEDLNGCSATATATITRPDTLVVTCVKNNVTCFGNMNGNIDLTVTGGVLPYTFLWSSGATTEDLANMGPGEYIVTLTDANGCKPLELIRILIDEPNLLTGVPVVSSNYNGFSVSCNGSTNGNVDLVVNGGTTPYQFSWNNGSTTEDLSLIGAGNYFVNIVDANGCSHINTISLSEPDSLVVSTTATQVTCNGLPNGAVNLTCIGGVSAYTYNWSNSAITQDLNPISAGNYFATITDANGCTITASGNVTEPGLLSATISTSNVVCHGENNGSATLSPSGGTQPYNYLWNNGQIASTATGLTAGSYSIIVTDINGCSMMSVINISEPAILAASTSGSDVTCNGGNNGTANVNISGGTQPYAYMWSSGETTNATTGLIANSYFVTVTDKNGCMISASATINEPSALSSSISVTSNVLCAGGNTGSALAIGSGGVAPYTYQWSNGIPDSTATGLIAGIYNVTVADAHNCTFLSQVTITEPNAISASTTMTSVLCNGENNGSATVSATGGSPAFSYLWSNSQAGPLATGLMAGTYSVTITDSNNCSFVTTSIVIEPAILAPTVSQTNVSCNGGSNGSASITVNGGTLPYLYLWNNGQCLANATGLGLGGYYVVVSDANGCTQSAIVSITDQSPVQVSYNSTTPPCHGEINGAIDLSTAGGVSPYTFSWSNGSNAEDISNLGAGTYIVTVHDANQCSKTDTIVISEPDSIQANISSSIYNNGYNISIHNGSNGSINLEVNGGANPYAYIWSNGDTVQDPSNLPAGNYWVVITDINGCSYTISAALNDPSNLEMPSGISPNGDGKNDNFVVHGLDVYPDNEILIFNRWGDLVYKKSGYMNNWNGNNEDGKSLPDGTYFVILNVQTSEGEKNLTGYVDVRK